MHQEPAKQFSFRLPPQLVQRVEECTEGLRAAGLDVNRAAVVRLLLTRALDSTGCNIELLLGGRAKRTRKRRA
jgi:hypothetical protein